MKTKRSLQIGMLVIAAAFALAACTPSGAPLQNNRGAAGAATQAPGSTAGETAQPPSDSGASGKPDTVKAALPDPSAGLANLKAYHAVMRVDATGKLDGQPFERHTQVEITRASNGDFDSQTRLADRGLFVRLAGLDGAFYRWHGEKATCQGSVDPPAEDEVIEPAALMLPVGSASRLGVEMVNKVSSVHYRFDKTGLARFKASGPVSGDIWIAEDGGYVVKYVLQAAAPQIPPAKGMAAAHTYTYELTPGGDALGLPEGCARVPADVPVISGAQNVARTSGMVTYQTSATPRAVVDFYGEKLPGLGWKTEMTAPAGEFKPPYVIHYSREKKRLTLSLSANEDQSLGVELTLSDLAALPAAAPQVTPTPAGTLAPEPTANPADSGLPAGVPLYPGATGLINAGGAVTFIAADPWKDVAAYYTKEMAANGWTNSAEYPVPDGVMQMWKKDGVTMSVTLMAEAEKTRVVISKAD